MKRPSKQKKEMERLLRRLEERKKIRGPAMAAEADFLIAVMKGSLKGENVEGLFPEIEFEDYSDVKWPEDHFEWLESCQADGDFSPFDGGRGDRMK